MDTVGAVGAAAAPAAAAAAGAAAAEADATSVNDLSPACFAAVFGQLGPADTGRAMCAHPLWADYLRDDTLWRDHLRSAYAADQACLPGGGDAGSYRAAFLAWTEHFADLPQADASRAVHAWARLRSWLRQRAPFIADSLRMGASAEQMAGAEAALGVKLPTALKAILRVHDGQALEFDSAFDRYVFWRLAPVEDRDAPPPQQPARWHPSMVWGLFGGYSFYNHLASVRLFSLERIVRWTLFFRTHVHMQLPPHVLVAGASADLGKLLLLNTTTGEVTIGGAQDQMPAAPAEGQEPQSSLLRWMEEWAARLDAGLYEVAELGVDPRRRAPGISLFPVAPPQMGTHVTRGLQVRVSSVFAPEMCGDGGSRYFFGYSVRFRLLPLEEQVQAQRQQQQQQQSSQGGGAQEGHNQQQQQQQRQQQQQQQQHSDNLHQRSKVGGQQQEGRQQDAQQRPRQGNGGPAGVDPLPLANGSAAGGSGPGPNSSSAAAGGPPARPLQRCQLESRHWRILGPGGELVNEVSGEGVIGEYPALEAGGREFPYQSCTHQAERLGFMEGGFAFVEGSLARPEGPAFTAVCPRFELRVPDFIY